jgi:hypothetical protein
MIKLIPRFHISSDVLSGWLEQVELLQLPSPCPPKVTSDAAHRQANGPIGTWDRCYLPIGANKTERRLYSNLGRDINGWLETIGKYWQHRAQREIAIRELRMQRWQLCKDIQDRFAKQLARDERKLAKEKARNDEREKVNQIYQKIASIPNPSHISFQSIKIANKEADQQFNRKLKEMAQQQMAPISGLAGASETAFSSPWSVSEMFRECWK